MMQIFGFALMFSILFTQRTRPATRTMTLPRGCELQDQPMNAVLRTAVDRPTTGLLQLRIKHRNLLARCKCVRSAIMHIAWCTLLHASRYATQGGTGQR